MALFDSLIDKLKYGAYFPTQAGSAIAGLINRNNSPGVTPAQPPRVIGSGPGLESDRSPFGMLPNVANPNLTQDPMQNYLNQLLRGLDAGRPNAMSIAELRNQARKQASLQFDPEIEALIGERSATKSRAGKNKRRLTSLYGGLADDYLADVKTSKKQTKEAKNAESQAFKQLQKDLAGQYSAQLEAQSKELSDLGVEAALGEATKGQKEDQSFLANLNATESAAQQRAIDLSGLADASYYQKGSNIARHEGTEAVTDLMSRLEDYLRQTGTQLSSLRGQKASAIEQLVNSMQTNQSNQASQFEQNRWGRLMQVAQLQRALTNDQIAQMGAGAQQKVPSRGLEGALGILNQSLGGNDGNASSALMNLLQSQEFREGRFESKNKQIVEMTPNNAAYLARQYASKNKLSAQETDALIKAVYAYYGKLR